MKIPKKKIKIRFPKWTQQAGKPVTELHATATSREEIVGSSAWLGELEAALRNLTAASLDMDASQWSNARLGIYTAKKALQRIIESNPRHSPSDPSSATAGGKGGT